MIGVIFEFAETVDVLASQVIRHPHGNAVGSAVTAALELLRVD